MTRSPSAHILLPALLLFSTLAAPAMAGSPAPDTAVAAPAPAPPPLLLDPTDMGFGVTVTFTRVPNAADLNDLGYLDNVQHVVLALNAWPADASELAPLAQLPLPPNADLIVLLPGYPATHAAAGAWNLLRRPLRIVMLVDGPPTDRGMLLEMNAMRGLTRVIVTVIGAQPSRAGFEQLQRPLSFRVERP